MPGGTRRNTTASRTAGMLETGKLNNSQNQDSRLSLVVEQRTVNYDSKQTADKRDPKKTQIRPDQN